MLGQLCSDISDGAIGQEFNGNGSTMWYIQKKEREIHQSAPETTPESAIVASVVCDEAMEKRLKCGFMR